eukprot:463996-Rhodomonas_salina.2
MRVLALRPSRSRLTLSSPSGHVIVTLWSRAGFGCHAPIWGPATSPWCYIGAFLPSRASELCLARDVSLRWRWHVTVSPA